MDGRKNTLEGAGDYIWLRYSTNVTIAGRNHTIEMGIPMPIGADEETREQLLREADAGMNQLAGHVENRVAQMLQRVQLTQGAIPTPTPSAKPSVAPPPRPISRLASAPTPQTASQPDAQPPQYRPASQPSPAPNSTHERRETVQEQQSAPQKGEVTVPPTRTTIGASMPTTGDISGNLSIPQFIRHVKDQFDLNPTQAMELLKLKSLSGINLREKLEQLQRIVGQESGNASDKAGTTGTTDPNLKALQSSKPEANPSQSGGKQGIASPTTASAQAGSSTATPAKQPIPLRPNAPSSNTSAASADNDSTARPQGGQEERSFGAVREEPSAYGFDEELDPYDQLEDIELDDLDLPRELTPQERIHAKNLVSKFRESQGAATANPARLKVLNNVAGGQVSDEQLQELTEGIWGTSSLKRLKVDQVEALISWAKEDDFISDVDVVLALLEEEAVARGNR